jgi:nitroreductase/ketosteroid isomerase-like protein
MQDMATRDEQLKAVDDFFDGPRELDRLSLMSDDVEWWNGLGKFPGAPGQTVFRGKEEIGAQVLGRAPAPPQPNGRRVDRYDLATLSFDDVRTIADGNHVFRQHTYRATTMRGRPYENVYGFLFRFTDEGLIDRIWEHWGTLQAWETLFQGPLVVTDPDLLLKTTPSVRKRLDLERPVEREVIAECMDIAVHAPNGSNQQPYRFVFVDDPVKKQGLADIYRAAMADFVNRPRTNAPEDNIDRSDAASKRMTESVMHLADHLHEVPVLCIPLVAGRTDGQGAEPDDRTNVFWQASRWGSVVPALWSFMLALRSRGLGSAWTTLTLVREREVAELLGIPYEKWMQAGLFPIAYTKGTDFRITPRKPAAEVTAWNGYALEG